MSNIQTHLWAGPGPKMLRWVVWVFLIGAFMAMNESHAQKCTGSTVTVNQTLPPTMAFSLVNQTKILGSYEATVTLSGCSGFTRTQSLTLTLITTEAFTATVLPTVSGREFVISGDRVSCFRINMCFDSVNKSFFDTVTPVTQSGISHEYKAQINGLDNSSLECVANLTNPNVGSGGVVEVSGLWTQYRVRINFSNSACSKIIIKVTGKITQTAAFYKSNAQTIRLDTDQDGSTNFRFVLVSEGVTPPVFTAIDLFSTPVSLTAQPGTCALSLSPTALNMGDFTLAKVSAIAQGNAVSTKPLAITIGNCTGFPIGLNKVLQWTFANPSADQTQMTNGTVSGASQGLSAEILADQKFTLDAIPVAMGSNKIKSGENYITSGKTSDNQTLNYTVRLVRNSETVSTGSFTSTATVTMSYK